MDYKTTYPNEITELDVTELQLPTRRPNRIPGKRRRRKYRNRFRVSVNVATMRRVLIPARQLRMII